MAVQGLASLGGAQQRLPKGPWVGTCDAEVKLRQRGVQPGLDCEEWVLEEHHIGVKVASKKKTTSQPGTWNTKSIMFHFIQMIS